MVLRTPQIVNPHVQDPSDGRQTLCFEQALLPSGWARDVVIVVDAGGAIAEVKTGVLEGTRVAGCALPGVPNLHSHAHQRAMAGLAESAGPSADSFWSWRAVMYEFANRMTPDQLEAIAAQVYVEMLKAGYTSVAEFQYLHHNRGGKPYEQRAEMTLRTCSAARCAGIAITSLPVLYRYGDFGGASPRPGQQRFVNEAEQYIDIVQAVSEYVRDDPDQDFGIAPHSVRAVDRELLQAVLNSGVAASGPIHIHIAEQVKEVDDCVAWCGSRPVAWLLDSFDIDSRWCLVHATHMTQAETRGLAVSGAVAGLCPTTEANLGDGLFPAKEFLGQGGAFGIGSDSQISVSPVEELRWLEYGQRLVERARNVLAGDDTSTGRRLFEGAVAGGARACGKKTGRIEAGYRADLITIDTEHPLLDGKQEDSLLDGWIFSGNANVVKDVFVGGRHVVANGVHPMQDTIALDLKCALDELARPS